MSETQHMVKDEQGNLVRFEQLYDRYFDEIFGFILHRVGRVAEAEDLTSQAFFKALKNLYRFRWSRGSFSAWLYRIAINEVNSHFRRKRPTSDFEDDCRHLASSARVGAELEEAQRKLGRDGVFQDLTLAIQKLKPDEQTLIVLRYFEQKPFLEIAEIMRKRQGTLTMRTHRALEKLKRDLLKRGIDGQRIRACFEESRQTEYQSDGLQASIAR